MQGRDAFYKRDAVSSHHLWQVFNMPRLPIVWMERTAAVVGQRANRIHEFIIANKVEWKGWLVSRGPLRLRSHQIVQPQALRAEFLDEPQRQERLPRQREAINGNEQRA